MKLLNLFWRLLRYRVAIMLVLFFLLAVALQEDKKIDWVDVFIVAVSLALSYVSATSSNDLADEKIDKINHPDSHGRPLINGSANRSEMKLMFGLSSIVAIAVNLIVGWKPALIIAVSVLINVLYSLPPFRLSYKTFLAPIALGLAYVGIPYALALSITRSNISVLINLAWFLGLYLMFIGRIILKDFRDRKGDKKYNKPTYLLRFGKNATCAFSFAGITSGIVIFLVLLKNEIWMDFFVLIYGLCIIFMLKRLLNADVGVSEQISIGVGAKMGNGLLITLLTYFLLKDINAGSNVEYIAVTLISALFFANYLNFIKFPDKAAIGYKG